MELEVCLLEVVALAVAHVVAAVVDERGGLEDREPAGRLLAQILAEELGADAVVRLGQPAAALAACPFRAEKPGFQRVLHQPGDVRLFVRLRFHHLFTIHYYLFVKPIAGFRGARRAGVRVVFKPNHGQQERVCLQTPQV